MDEIVPNLYLGDVFDALQALREGGWAILNVASEANDFASKHYDSIPFEDHKPIPTDLLKSAVDWIKFHLGRGDKCLVHCMAGSSRSAAVIAAYLHEVSGYSIPAAIALLRDKRSAVDPCPAILDGLKSYYNQTNKEENHVPDRSS